MKSIPDIIKAAEIPAIIIFDVNKPTPTPIQHPPRTG
ncbi:hypothetical protein LCGC14_1610780 [marine sediment metagenome]|uniref:Uncharacterized protein n=1 Tax=marine sediment metagenome TaxID=412755 RepID=A0A0F9IV29_9ZZZZ